MKSLHAKSSKNFNLYVSSQKFVEVQRIVSEESLINVKLWIQCTQNRLLLWKWYLYLYMEVFRQNKVEELLFFIPYQWTGTYFDLNFILSLFPKLWPSFFDYDSLITEHKNLFCIFRSSVIRSTFHSVCLQKNVYSHTETHMCAFIFFPFHLFHRNFW